VVFRFLTALRLVHLVSTYVQKQQALTARQPTRPSSPRRVPLQLYQYIKVVKHEGTEACSSSTSTTTNIANTRY
jgi:hypothetical protein